MTSRKRLGTLCVASAVTTAWVGAPATAGAAMDMDYTTFGGFEEAVAGDSDAAIATKKKAIRKKATFKKAKKKATKKKAVGLFEGEDRVPRAVQGASTQISDTEIHYEFDFQLDFDATSDIANMVWSILALVDVEGESTASIGMLVNPAFVLSLEGQTWSSLFPSVSYDGVEAALNGLPAENGDLDAGTLLPLDTLANVLPVIPPNFAFLSGDQLTAPVNGLWLMFTGDQAPSFVLAEADGEISVVPEPGALLLLGAGAAGLAGTRRHGWRWPEPAGR